jgi:hypothetical protein
VRVQKLGSDKIRKAYAYFRRRADDQHPFTLGDLMAASGWSQNSARANLSKKLGRFLTRDADGYHVTNFAGITEEAFCRVCSQSSTLSGDPLKPIVSPDTEALVSKARESALAAVQHFNNPLAVFRSGNFIVLMVIAFTSLLHAVFERDGIDYVARGKDGSAKLAGKDEMLWELSQSISEYVRLYGTKYSTEVVRAMTTNIEFFLPIRHKVEHRQMPQLDPMIAGHCQSMLLNFERVLVTEFTAYYSLSSSLALALQFSTERTTSTTEAMRSFHVAEYEQLKRYIQDFHAGLSDEIMGDPGFALRMWLVPKPAKHARASDMTLEYVPLDQTNADQMAALEKSVVAITRVVRETQNDAHLLPGAVSKRVEAAIARRFAASSHHAKAALHHKVRPPKGATDPTATQPQYCVFNKAFNQYVYTEDWVQFLIREYKDESKYNTLFGAKTSTNGAH